MGGGGGGAGGERGGEWGEGARPFGGARGPGDGGGGGGGGGHRHSPKFQGKHIVPCADRVGEVNCDAWHGAETAKDAEVLERACAIAGRIAIPAERQGQWGCGQAVVRMAVRM